LHTTTTLPQQRFPTSHVTASKASAQSHLNANTAQSASSTPTRAPPKSKSRSPAAAKEKVEKKTISSSSRLEDDDINDVAAMGGVNLQEESLRILSSTSENIGQQIRSCKDESLIYTTPLHTRINKIGK